MLQEECSRKIKNKCEAEKIYSLRSKFKLSILLEATKFPKSTYMYWQNRFDIENPDKDIEEKIKSIFETNSGTYGYFRIIATLRYEDIFINQNKVRRIMKKLELKCTAFSHKSRKYNSYKGTIGKIADNKINRRFATLGELFTQIKVGHIK